MFVNECDVEAIKPKFDDKVEGCCGIPHIHKVHCVRSEGSYQVSYSLTSDEVGYRLSFRPTNSCLQVLPAVTEDAAAAAAGLPTAEHVTFANWVVIMEVTDIGTAVLMTVKASVNLAVKIVLHGLLTSQNVLLFSSNAHC